MTPYPLIPPKVCPRMAPIKNKRPMGHIAHLRKQFKSINTYDYR